GFAIFSLSSFPPTQRFGLVVVSGTVIDILANLFVLPLVGGADWGKRQRLERRLVEKNASRTSPSPKKPSRALAS
ncbi:MAG TPA: hypothetical protein VJK27_00850, partial [Terriglobales bacterium]|nr:hypothetical protein [Terriglobales bacterium]